jgi:hypothetical protein
LTRIYDDPSFKPSVPELVVVHMVFATIYFQYGVRNLEEPANHARLNELSNKHYHWSLSKFFDLAASQTVTAVQALAMIVSHTRNFPKPGCSLTIASFAFVRAIDMNLHRAVKIPGGGTTLENEMRKRVWWAVLAILCTLNGRLGRPMPLAVEEFDVEFPIPIDDEYLGEEGILDPSKIGHCNFHVGLMGFKVTPLYMEMYSKIYSVRRDPDKYVEVVNQLEGALRDLLDNLPDELKMENGGPANQVFALYTQAFCLEYTLCLRHPSVCLTDDPEICAENTKICEDTARKLLKVVGSLFKMKSLDTTWYQLAVYVAAIFSTLVAHWQRRYEITAFEVETLRSDMSLWLNIIREIGRLLGRLLVKLSLVLSLTQQQAPATDFRPRSVPSLNGRSAGSSKTWAVSLGRHMARLPKNKSRLYYIQWLLPPNQRNNGTTPLCPAQRAQQPRSNALPARRTETAITTTARRRPQRPTRLSRTPISLVAEPA